MKTTTTDQVEENEYVFYRTKNYIAVLSYSKRKGYGFRYINNTSIRRRETLVFKSDTAKEAILKAINSRMYVSTEGDKRHVYCGSKTDLRTFARKLIIHKHDRKILDQKLDGLLPINPTDDNQT